MSDTPLTLGTAGHIDHGKTALVGALTGHHTDRLPAERERGISIELGYAPLTLPGGRRLSVVDVPGHERFVRTMVAGATGIDLFLLVIAADDGVMPQTLEHWTVLQALGVRQGVVAITKTDLADPADAAAQARELVGADALIVATSTRDGSGVADVAAALERVSADVAGRGAGASDAAALLHVDRVFSVHGAGTVVTGTLWSGTLAVGDELELLPARRRVRVRSLQVHDAPRERAAAGQRVAVNLARVDREAVARGDVLAADGAGVVPAWILDVALDLREAPTGHVHVHHGTRESPARLVALGDDLWQVRAERQLLARPGDRVVVRAASPPDTLGGGVVVEPGARRHGPGEAVRARLERLRRGQPAAEPEAAPAVDARAEATPEPEPLAPQALAVEERLRAAGHEPPSDAALGDDAVHLPALRAAGRAVRIGRAMHAHPQALEDVRRRAEAIMEREGELTLARLRDELSTSRKYAQALIEHLDAIHVTVRQPDDRRLPRRSTRRA
jgi:selenocysteine-specific elongation factor